MSRQTQCERILALLQAHKGEWVSLPRILDLHIAQYNARIYELRAQYYDIECRREWTGDGQVHSFYRLRAKQGQLELLRTA